MKTMITFEGAQRTGYKLFEKKMLHMERHVMAQSVNPWLVWGLAVCIGFFIIDAVIR